MVSFVTYLVMAALLVALLLACASNVLFLVWALHALASEIRWLNRLVNRSRLARILYDYFTTRNIDFETTAGVGGLAFIILLIDIIIAAAFHVQIQSSWPITIGKITVFLILAPYVAAFSLFVLFIWAAALYWFGAFLARLVKHPLAEYAKLLASARAVRVNLRAAAALLATMLLGFAAASAFVAAVVAVIAGFGWVLGELAGWTGTWARPEAAGRIAGLLLLAVLALSAGLGAFTLFVIALGLGRLLVETLRDGGQEVPLFLAAVPWNDEAEVVARVPTAASVARAVMAAIGFALGGLPGGGDERPVFRGSRRRAEEASARRHGYIRAQLEQYAERAPEAELLDLPPGLADRVDRRVLTPSMGDARIVTLDFQQKRAEFALFGRVVDALTGLLRTAEFSGVREVEVVLRRLRWWEASPGEYPWIVVVRTDRRREIAKALHSMREWLGIGAHVARPVRWQPQFRCNASGLTGTIAGYVAPAASAERLLLTCAHVVGDNCADTLVNRVTTAAPLSRDGRHEQIEPDAALLIPHACCDAPPQGAREVEPMSTAEVDDASRSGRKVRRAGGSQHPGIGYVKNLLWSYPISQERSEYFPSFIVESWPASFVGAVFSWPPFLRRFSRPGDSGAWVLLNRADGEKPAWLGIVAAGGKGFNRRESYVVMAEPLMAYLSRRLKNKGPLSAFLTAR